jgi:hypothetical protein
MEDPGRLHISGLCMITLGVGLLGQAVLAGWAYCTTKVPTWSSSPLDTALASYQRGFERTVLTPCAASAARYRARPTRWRCRSRPSSRIAGSAAWCGCSGAPSRSGRCRRFAWRSSFEFGSRSPTASNAVPLRWWPIPDVGSPSPFAAFTFILSPDPVDPVCLLVVLICQSFATLGLHFADLLVNVSR